MPNWCSNNVTIEADPDSELFRRLMNSVNDEKELFNQFVPQPKFENDQEWYGWNIENWGTKWDATPWNVMQTTNGVTFALDTAWSPPIRFYEQMEELGYRVTAYYMEEGMAFVGKFEDGNDEFYEYGHMDADTMESELPDWVDDEFGLIERTRDDEAAREEDEWNDYLEGLEKTPWYPKKIKPVREGQYEVKTKGWPYPMKCNWDGKKWARWENDTIKVTDWRGITEVQHLDIMIDELVKLPV